MAVTYIDRRLEDEKHKHYSAASVYVYLVIGPLRAQLHEHHVGSKRLNGSLLSRGVKRMRQERPPVPCSMIRGIAGHCFACGLSDIIHQTSASIPVLLRKLCLVAWTAYLILGRSQ